MSKKDTTKDYTPVQMLFLARLERLLTPTRKPAQAHFAQNSTRLVHMAIHSTLLDCRDLGVEDDARRILEKHGIETRKVGK